MMGARSACVWAWLLAPRWRQRPPLLKRGTHAAMPHKHDDDCKQIVYAVRLRRSLSYVLNVENRVAEP